ncbi:hypothetical protein KDL29_09585 [bacterium]|nr:hypothetical protein [bacterium]
MYSVVLLMALLLLVSCGRVPVAMERELNVLGPMLVGDDNMVLNWQGSGMLSIDAEKEAGDTATTSQASQQGYPVYSSQLTEMVAGPDGQYLFPDKGPSGGVRLVFSDRGNDSVLLSRPDTASDGSSGNFVRYSGQDGSMGFLGTDPFVVYNQQQIVGFDQQGNPSWEYMGGYMISHSQAQDYQHLLVFGRDGELACLDSQGRVSWTRKGVQQAQAFGDRILVTGSDSLNLVCLDWEGTELWIQDHSGEKLGYVYAKVDEAGNRFAIQRSWGIDCYDADGKRLWRCRLESIGWSSLELSRDGYTFLRIYDRDFRNSWFGGRIANRVNTPFHWLCINPQGKVLWRSKKMDGYPYFAHTGSGGTLFTATQDKQGLGLLSAPE